MIIKSNETGDVYLSGNEPLFVNATFIYSDSIPEWSQK